MYLNSKVHFHNKLQKIKTNFCHFFKVVFIKNFFLYSSRNVNSVFVLKSNIMKKKLNYDP